MRSTIVGFADTLPEGESEISFTVFASGAKQSPGRVEVYEVYVAYFFSGIAAPAARNDVPFLRVILNDSEESHRRTDGYMYFFTLVVRYFADAQYDVRSPIGALRHFPRRRKRVLFYCLCERSAANSREGELPNG